MPTIHYLTNKQGKLQWVSTEIPRQCRNELKGLNQNLICTPIASIPSQCTRSRVKEGFGSSGSEQYANDSERTDVMDEHDLHDKSYYISLCREFTKRRIRDKSKIRNQRGKIKLLKQQLRAIVKN